MVKIKHKTGERTRIEGELRDSVEPDKTRYPSVIAGLGPVAAAFSSTPTTTARLAT
jgi:hypothetical protein